MIDRFTILFAQDASVWALPTTSLKVIPNHELIFFQEPKENFRLQGAVPLPDLITPAFIVLCPIFCGQRMIYIFYCKCVGAIPSRPNKGIRPLLEMDTCSY